MIGQDETDVERPLGSLSQVVCMLMRGKFVERSHGGNRKSYRHRYARVSLPIFEREKKSHTMFGSCRRFVL